VHKHIHYLTSHYHYNTTIGFSPARSESIEKYTKRLFWLLPLHGHRSYSPVYLPKCTKKTVTVVIIKPFFITLSFFWNFSSFICSKRTSIYSKSSFICSKLTLVCSKSSFIYSKWRLICSAFEGLFTYFIAIRLILIHPTSSNSYPASWKFHPTGSNSCFKR